MSLLQQCQHFFGSLTNGLRTSSPFLSTSVLANSDHRTSARASRRTSQHPATRIESCELRCLLTTLDFRFVNYNIAGDARTGLDTVLQAIGTESFNGFARQIDLLALQEVDTQATDAQAVVNLLNGIYGAGVYARGSLDAATSGGGRPGIVYNTQTLQLQGEVAVGTVGSTAAARQTVRYQFQAVGADASSVFYVYNSHYKASNTTTDANRRAAEATAIRTNSNALGQGANIIYTGDFNLYRSTEAAYTNLLAAGNGQAFDPLNRPGNWSGSSSFRDIFTQSPAASPPSGLVGGGLSDRFDFQLMSGELFDGLGLDYRANSYRTFANNGSVNVGQSINVASNTALAGLANRLAVLNLLTTVTDHLPLVADYRWVSAEQPPTTTGIPDVSVNEDAANTDINLWSRFSDPNTASSGLTYSVTGNTNAGLFSSVTINAATGVLTLDYAANVFGASSFTVRATDPGGLFVETSFAANVAAVNDAPTVSLPGSLPDLLTETGLLLNAGNLIQVNDIDAGASPLQVTLTTTRGSLSFGSIAGLSFTQGDGSSDTTVTFTGSEVNINAALSTLVLNAGSSAGAGTLSVTVNDQGANGSGGALSGTGSVNYQVTSTTLAGGVFSLFSTSVDDTITLSYLTGSSEIQILMNGVTTNYSAAGVTSIVVDARDGNDIITLGGDLNSLALNSLQLLGGDGDDRFVIAAPVNSSSRIINGGNGEDRSQFSSASNLSAWTINDPSGGNWLDFSGLATGVTVNLASTAAQALNGQLTLTLGAADIIRNVVGSALADSITGNADDNQITGGAGDDTLAGGLGNDQYLFDVSTANGSDFVVENASEGFDQLDLSSTIASIAVNVDLRSNVARVIAPNLTLRLNSGSTFESARGGAGNDVLIGNALNNVLEGYSGNDILYGFAGNDDLNGGEGDDSYMFDADSQLNTDFVIDSQGTDTLNFLATTTLGTTIDLGLLGVDQVVNTNLSLRFASGTVIKNVLGTDLVDNVTGNNADNLLDLRGGNDIATAAGGNDTLIGGAGDDTLIGETGNDTYLFDADIAQGIDTLTEVVSGGGVDTLDFSQTNLTASPIAIDLRITGVQVVRSGLLSLSLGLSNNFENVTGGAGNDLIIGNNVANLIRGGGGDDQIYGLPGNDTLDGGNGNDVYLFDADSNIGSDTVTDSAGIDTLNWLNTTGFGVAINLAITTPQNVVAGLHTLTLASGNSIENLVGTNLADTLLGNDLVNVITANGGNDILEGFAGNDTLVGGSGNDEYRFDADTALGSDLLNETGGGIDLLNFSATAADVRVDLRVAASQIVNTNLSIGLQNATAWENVQGGGGNDTLIGSSIDNILSGGLGNDVIFGQSGNDVLVGGGGNDTLQGEAGRDLIFGGAGSDNINGGTESDLVIGGTTSYDDNFASLVAIRTAWTAAGDYASRIAAVQAGANPLTAATVFNDTSADTLRGGTGTTDDQLDLFFSSVLDTLPDFGTGLETNVLI